MELFKVSHHPVQFGRHKHCGSIKIRLVKVRHPGSGDIMVLVCHVILQWRVMEGSCDFMRRSSSKEVTILSDLVAIGTLVVEICF